MALTLRFNAIKLRDVGVIKGFVLNIANSKVIMSQKPSLKPFLFMNK